MGKKRITTTAGQDPDSLAQKRSALTAKARKKSLTKGVINIFASYNNTLVNVCDERGDAVIWTSAGLMGFKGTKKSTPFAATIVAKEATERARVLGLEEVRVVVRGVGPGREGAIRGVASTGVNINSIIDATPLPHNGVKRPKPRRV